MHAMPILPSLSPVGAKSLTVTFDAGRLSSDGGLYRFNVGYPDLLDWFRGARVRAVELP